MHRIARFSCISTFIVPVDNNKVIESLIYIIVGKLTAMLLP